MKRLVFASVVTVMLATVLFSAVDLSAQRRRRVVVRRAPVRRTTIVVRPGHPIRRVLPRTVVVRPARTTVVVGRPLVWLTPIVWRPAVVTLPPRERLLWEESEAIGKDEEWVDCNFGVDKRGGALYLEIEGAAQLNFAEVTFENGDVQVVDFEEKDQRAGVYQVLDFSDGRIVKTVRVLAKSTADESILTLYLRT
jgi:hypothetical protein